MKVRRKNLQSGLSYIAARLSWCRCLNVVMLQHGASMLSVSLL